MATALLDTTLLSNFAHIRRPDLLRMALGDNVATAPATMAELHAGEELGLVFPCDWNWLTVLEPTDEERRLAAELERILDPGEAECLAIAQMRQCKLLSDDFRRPPPGPSAQPYDLRNHRCVAGSC